MAIDMGVLRIAPLLRPRTESRYWEPTLIPRRSIAALRRIIQTGGGLVAIGNAKGTHFGVATLTGRKLMSWLNPA